VKALALILMLVLVGCGGGPGPGPVPANTFHIDTGKVIVDGELKPGAKVTAKEYKIAISGAIKK